MDNIFSKAQQAVNSGITKLKSFISPQVSQTVNQIKPIVNSGISIGRGVTNAIANPTTITPNLINFTKTKAPQIKIDPVKIEQSANFHLNNFYKSFDSAYTPKIKELEMKIEKQKSLMKNKPVELPFAIGTKPLSFGLTYGELYNNYKEWNRQGKINSDRYWDLNHKKMKGIAISPEDDKWFLEKQNEMFMNMIPAGGVGKVGIKAGEKVLPELAGKVAAKAKMKDLLGYSDEMRRLGFPEEVISRSSVTKGKQLIKEALDGIPFGADSASLKEAEAKIGSTKLNKWLETPRVLFQDWVNTRRSSVISAVKAKQSFTPLDEEGMEGILKFQQGFRKGQYADLQKWFDDKYKIVQKAYGTEYKEDYLPQLWANSKEEVNKVFGRVLTQRPSFTLKSIFKDYQEGIDAGLTPRFNKISDLVYWYEQRATKALADHAFFKGLIKENLIAPDDIAPLGWKTIDPDRFPKFVTKLPDGEKYTGVYKAPAELADKINNYLGDNTGVINDIANVSTKLKNIFLSAGIPKTGLNFHGVNILARNVLTANNPVSGFIKGTYYMLYPKAGLKFFMGNLDSATQAMKNGLTLSTEEHAMEQIIRNSKSNVVVNGVNKLIDFHKVAFEDPLFAKIIPALKLQRYNEVYEDLVKHFPEKEAGKMASKIVNNQFGGINWEELGRSKLTQDIFRAFFLAPDWAETNLKLAKNSAQYIFNPTNPAGKAYRSMMRSLMLAYGSASLTNKLLSGHWMHENESGHQFEIHAGFTGDGKARYIRPFGTAVDFVRIPYETAFALASGDVSTLGRVIRNRLSPVAGQVVGQLTNTNYAGQPISKKDTPIIDQLLARGAEASSVILPSYVSAPIKYALGSGDLNKEQALASAIEIPVRYGGSVYSKTQEEKRNLFQNAGLKGEELYNAMMASKDKKSNSTSDLAINPNTDSLSQIYMQEKQMDEKNNRIREIFASGLTREQIDSVLQKEGLGTYKEAEVEVAKSLGVENGQRPTYLLNVLKPLNGEDFVTTANYYAENSVLTNSVVEYWQDSGEINSDQAKYLKQIIKNSKLKENKTTASKSYKVKAPKKIGYIKLKKAKQTKVKAPKISSLKIKPLRNNPVKWPTLKVRGYA